MNREKHEKHEKVLFPDGRYATQTEILRIANTSFRDFRAFCGLTEEHYNEQDL